MQKNFGYKMKLSGHATAFALALCVGCGSDTEQGAAANSTAMASEFGTSTDAGTTDPRVPEETGASGGLGSSGADDSAASGSSGADAETGEMLADAEHEVWEAIASEEAHNYGIYRYRAVEVGDGSLLDITLVGQSGDELGQIVVAKLDEQRWAIIVPPLCQFDQGCLPQEMAPMTVFFEEAEDGDILLYSDRIRGFAYRSSEGEPLETQVDPWDSETEQLYVLGVVLDDLSQDDGAERKCGKLCKKFWRFIRRAACILKGIACCVKHPEDCFECGVEAVACWKKVK